MRVVSKALLVHATLLAVLFGGSTLTAQSDASAPKEAETEAKAKAEPKAEAPAAEAPAPLEETEKPLVDPELMGKFVQTRPGTALEGNDPIILATSNKLQAGDPQHEYYFDGQVYRFASPENVEQFKADPGTFAPALGGLSVIAYRDRKAAEAGTVQHFSTFSGRIYLFASAEEKAKFDGGPGNYFDADVLMDGFSPVSLVDEEKLRRGDKEFLVIYDGRRVYLFNQDEKEKFTQDPGKYYPTLGGLDPVALVRGESVFGIARFSVVFKNRLYMTSSSENREEFLKNPIPYADLDVALGGNCPVTLVEENQKQPGYYGLSVVNRGRRLLFASEEKRKRFVEDPQRYDR